MKGLIIKEFLGMRQYFKTLGALTAMFIIIAISTKSLSIFSTLIAMFPMIFTITSFSYDNYNHWDEFIISFPISRSDIVKSKYVFMLLITAISAAAIMIISFIIHLVFPIINFEFIIGIGISLAISITLGSVITPLIYKFGVEKARYVLISLVLVPTLGILALSKLNIPMPSDAVINKLLCFSPLFVLFLLFGSYIISKSIFTKKDL